MSEGEVASILRQPDVVGRFNDLSLPIVNSTPEEFSKLLATDLRAWTKIVEDADIKVE